MILRAIEWLVATIGILAGFTEFTAQVLPSHHHRTVDIAINGDYAARVLFSKSAGSFMRYTVGYDNTDQKTVTFLWEGAYFTNGVVDYSLRDLEWRTVSTSFRPLAVAPEGGMGSVLFVVGWYDRTGELTVERWTLGLATLAQAIGPGGNPLVTLTPPPITKVEIYRGTAMGPVYDAVFHPVARELLMLADNSAAPTFSKKFYSLDCESPSAVPILRADLNNIALLPVAQGLKLGVTNAGGVYVFIFDIPKWGDYGSVTPVTNQTHVLCDENADGVYEISFQNDSASIIALGGAVNWNYNYTAASPP